MEITNSLVTNIGLPIAVGLLLSREVAKIVRSAISKSSGSSHTVNITQGKSMNGREVIKEMHRWLEQKSMQEAIDKFSANIETNTRILEKLVDKIDGLDKDPSS